MSIRRASGRLLRLPLLPLRGVLVFPHAVTQLDIGRPRSLRAVEAAMATGGRIVLAMQKDARKQEPDDDEIHAFGTVAKVQHLLKLPEGHVRAVIEGEGRVRIERIIDVDPFYRAEARELRADSAGLEPEGAALMRVAMRTFEDYVRKSDLISADVLATASAAEEPGRLADVIAEHLQSKLTEKQALLETLDGTERLERVCALLNHEIELLDLERRIHNRVRQQMEATQKEYYLREQLKAIQQELGELDGRSNEIDAYREQIAAARMPKAARERADQELRRLEKMPPMAAESVVVRNYLDWLMALPWNKTSRDRIDLAAAGRILDAEHYGLEKVKERILEFLAVRRLAKDLGGPILCLAGPPGVGKTSLARSIAKAMNRRFVRMSLGGVRDEAEIRGHRRTYVGAMPGRILQAVRRAGVRNPVILLDEIDKIQSDFRGDPASALLETLDPEQNHAFSDHYIEIPFNLRDVFFITTANLLAGMPPALRDRLEVIELPGYTDLEKEQIARRHLLPKQLRAHGLDEAVFKVSDGALRTVIAEYTRESGVRSLERALGTLCRKGARKYAQYGRIGGVTRRNLARYLGPAQFPGSQLEENDRVGLAVGLAYTALGGETLMIEVSALPGKGELILTGTLGEVMRESAQAGLSYIRARSRRLGLPGDFYERFDLHIHVPQGGIPKDGPSAGITIATAVASALSKRPVRKNVAMTGEITLRGRVLAVGGLREKILAAKRAGVSNVILPAANRAELADLPDDVRRGLVFHEVHHMDEVLSLALLPPLKAPIEGLPFQAEGDAWHERRAAQ